MCTVDSQVVETEVSERLDAKEAFTTACISHPIIAKDKDVRHYDVSQAVKAMWQQGMESNDGVRYLRTLIAVYPNGPGSSPQQAFLYYPDDGSYNPADFRASSRVLIRNHDDDNDSAITVTNTADGSAVTKQCQVQQKNRALNVPKILTDQLGWGVGAIFSVNPVPNGLEIKSSTTSSQKVDKEGRIRLYGPVLDNLGTTNPTAMVVVPTKGDSYILISQLKLATPPTTPAPPVDTDDTDASTQAAAGSVWNK